MKGALSFLSILLILVPALTADAATPLDAVVSLDGLTQSVGTRVRILNASPDTGPIDMYVAQNREAEGVVFEEVSIASDIASGSFLITVTRSDETEPLVEQGVSFIQGEEKILVLTGFEDALTLDELGSSRPGSSPSTSYLRIFHASPDTASVDLVVTGQGVVHSDTEYREGSEYEALDEGTYDLEIRPTGEGTAILTIPGVWLKGSQFYTVYLTGLTADIGEPDTEFTTFVPAAARDRGALGSFFVTDLDIMNPNDAATSCAMNWLPRDADNSNPTMSDPITVDARSSKRFEDVLGSVFGFDDTMRAVGALAIVCDSPDMVVFSRTFNRTDEGTFGQGIPGIPSDELIRPGQVKRIIFMSESEAYRSNLGLMNGTEASIAVNYARYLPDGTRWANSQREIPPWGNIQINRVFEGADPVEGAYIEIWTETFGGAFAAYGSVLDNPTSDPTTVSPQ